LTNIKESYLARREQESIKREIEILRKENEELNFKLKIAMFESAKKDQELAFLRA